MQKTSSVIRKPENAQGTWPAWGEAFVSVAILIHITAIVSAALAAPPSSKIEIRFAKLFSRYNELINQGYGYRFYAKLDTTENPAHPRPWGTPVVTAELEFEDGSGRQVKETVRLPGRQTIWPRLRYQRQLDLAYHLSADPRWAASYARHLCKTRGCSKVMIYSQEHHIPNLVNAREAADRGAWRAVDLEGEATYTPRVLLGEFRCVNF